MTVNAKPWVSALYSTRLSVFHAGVIFLAIACDSPTEPGSDLPDIRHLVVGAALENLDETGRFVLAPVAPFTQTMIMPDYAVAIAEHLAQHLNTLQTLPIPEAIGWREELEEALGRSIDWSRVRAGPRSPYPIHTFIEPLPDSLHPSTYNNWGPYYVVPLFLGKEEVGAIGVAATTTTRIVHGGFFRGGGGGDFRVIRLNFGPGSSVVIAPEAAVEFTAELFGTRVREPPYLLKPGHQVAAYLAPWVLKLERSVTVRRLADGQNLETDSLYVGQYPSSTDSRTAPPGTIRMFVPALEQPTQELIFSWIGDDPDPFTFDWPIIEGVPVTFMEVEAVLP